MKLVGAAQVDILYIREVSAPGTPGSGLGVLYGKTDGKVYYKNDAGTEYDLTGGGGTVSFGTVGQIPYMNSGGTDFDYSATLSFVNGYLTCIGSSTTPGDVGVFVQNSNSGGDTRFTVVNSAGGGLILQATGSGYTLSNYATMSAVGGIGLRIFANTDVSTGGSETLKLYAGGYDTSQERANISNVEFVINEIGVAYDFRIEGDTKTHLFYTKGSADEIHIGSSTDYGSYILQVDGHQFINGQLVLRGVGSSGTGIIFGENFSSSQIYQEAPGGGLLVITGNVTFPGLAKFPGSIETTTTTNVFTDSEILGLSQLIMQSRATIRVIPNLAYATGKQGLYIAPTTDGYTDPLIQIRNAAETVATFYVNTIGETYTAGQATHDLQIKIKEISAPSTPGSGYGVLYPKSDGILYWKDDAGTEYDLTAGIATSLAISGLTTATATNTINNGAYIQEWQWNSLAAGYGLFLTADTTAAALNTQCILGVVTLGANASSNQKTHAAAFGNAHTGTGSTNVALVLAAENGVTNIGLSVRGVGGTNNYAIIVEENQGYSGFGLSAPTAEVHILGVFRYQDANEALGKVLFSDVNGNGSWKFPNEQPYRLVTANNYNIVASDATLDVDNDANNWTINLPDPSTCPGKKYTIKRLDGTSTGTLTVDSAAGNIQSAQDGSYNSTFDLPQWQGGYCGAGPGATWQSNGTNWVLISTIGSATAC